MKGQVGLEYMAVLAIMLVFLVPLFYMANERLSVSQTTSQARAAVNTIVTSANTVYAQSPGSMLTTNVFVPEGYDSAASYLANKTVSMRFNLIGGTPYDVFGVAKANLSGSLPPYPGYHIMTFFLASNGAVVLNTSAT